MTTSSSDVADEKQYFLNQKYKKSDSEIKTLQGKEQLRQDAREEAANNEPTAFRTNVKEITKTNENTTSYSMNEIKAKGRLRVEQHVGLLLKNLKIKIFGQTFDELLLATDRIYKHHKANERRINLKDMALCSGNSTGNW